jgi:signal transduction histidine kinase
MEVDPRSRGPGASGVPSPGGATALATRGLADPPDAVDALLQIARFASTAATEDGVVADVVRLVERVIPCERAIVCLHDAGANQMLVHEARRHMASLPLWEPSIVRRVFLSGEGEIVNDVLADPDSTTLTPEFLDARHIAVAPLGISGSRLGVVTAINSTRGAFVEDDLEMLARLGDRAALLIENHRLRSGRARQARELSGLHRLTRLLAGAETVDYAIGESVRIVRDLLECAATAVFLFDDARNSLVVRPPVAGAGDDPGDLAISLAEPSLPATVFRTDTALLSNHAANDAWVSESLRRVFDIHTLLVVPLTSGRHPIGVLQAINSRSGSFDEADLRFTTLLGARIAAVLDATRARERERALLQRLREADRTKTEFVSMLAHELKGPMTTIKGYGQVLHEQDEEISGEQRHKFLTYLVDETTRLSELVNDLLDVSRVEAGSVRYDFEAVSLAELIDSILAVHPSLTAGHTVVSDLDPEVPDVLADKDRLRQILLNLLSNAVRHAPEGTTVSVRARGTEMDDERAVHVSVIDQGIGIAAADLDRIFSKFVMLPKPEWITQGTGLGLYITKGIVEAHGGRIWVESESGKGSTFHFTLRAAPSTD